MGANDLLGFIRDLAEHLALGRGIGQEVTDALSRSKASLEEVYARYEEPAPEGAELIRDYMLEALQLNYKAIEYVEAYLAEGERANLTEAVLAAEEADDIFSTLEEIIGQNSQWLGQFNVG